jgi:hypothetical protein
MLKARLDMIYEVKTDGDGRNFSGLHETLLPLAAVTRKIFQQLRGTSAKKSKKVQARASVAGAAPDSGIKAINGAYIMSKRAFSMVAAAPTVPRIISISVTHI